MANKMSSVRLGIFIFIGAVLLVLAVFLVGQKNAMFSSTFEVKTYFKDIQGLRTGATVRLSGTDVGSVSNIKIVNDTTGRVEVTLSLLSDIKRFIRTDTQASIETEGLVGNKVVVLQIGSSSADPVREGGVIQSKEPVSMSAIIEETQGIMKYMKNITKDLADISNRVNSGQGTIGKLLVDDELYNSANSLTKTADSSLNAITHELNKVTALFDSLGGGVEKVVSNINNVVIKADTIIDNIKKGKGLLGGMLMENGRYDTLFNSTIVDIEKTAADARLSASRLAENMEALKHNWLFKSYFENRGYWDKAESEDIINDKLEELNKKIKMLDERISTLKELRNSDIAVKKATFL